MKACDRPARFVSVSIVIGLCLSIVMGVWVFGGSFVSAAAADDVYSRASETMNPTPIYTENFEHGVNATGTPSSLNGYVSTYGLAYDANSYWKDSNVCNGFIVSANNQISMKNIKNTYCGDNDAGWNNGVNNTWGKTDGDYAAVRAKAYALGNGNSANHALSTNTSGGLAKNVPGKMFDLQNQSISKLQQLTGKAISGRFINFSVDAAATACAPSQADKFKDPQLYFTMTGYGTNTGQSFTTPLNVDENGNSQAVDPCDFSSYVDVNKDSNFPREWNGLQYSSIFTGVRYGTIYGSKSVLIGSDVSSMGLELYNGSQASSLGDGTGKGTYGKAGKYEGNDGAVDNIRIVDATPKMTKMFVPAVTSIGSTSRLIITVHNRTDNASKSGWSFNDTLPQGLYFAANPNIAGSCLTNGTKASVNITSKILSVTNGTLQSGSSTAAPTTCTVEADVTSTAAAQYANGASNISNTVGIDPPDSPAYVKFTKGAARWQKVDAFSKAALAGSQWQITRTDTNLPSGSNDTGQVSPKTGVSYTLTDTGSVTSGCPQTSSSDSYSQDADSCAGYLAAQYLPWGKYTLKETKAPTNYDLNAQTYAFTIDAGGLTVDDANAVISNPVGVTDSSGNLVSDSQITNSQKPATLTLVKKVSNPSAGTGYAVSTDWMLSATGSGAAAGTTVSGVTGKAAVTNVSVPPGTYTLSEAFSGSGSSGSAYQWTGLSCTANTVNVGLATTTSGNVVTGGSITLSATQSVTCTYTNTPQTGSVTWTKTDVSGDSLKDSQWVLTGPGVPSNAVIKDCTMQGSCGTGLYDDQNPAAGVFKLTRQIWGSYTLTESKAPAGYALDSTAHGYAISPQSLNYQFSDTFVNTQKNPPTLPFTGGLSTEAYLISGSLLMIFALGWAAASLRRKDDEV